MAQEFEFGLRFEFRASSFIILLQGQGHLVRLLIKVHRQEAMCNGVTEAGVVETQGCLGRCGYGACELSMLWPGFTMSRVRKPSLPQAVRRQLSDCTCPGGHGHVQRPLKPGVAFPKEGSLWPLSVMRVEDVDDSDT